MSETTLDRRDRRIWRQGSSERQQETGFAHRGARRRQRRVCRGRARADAAPESGTKRTELRAPSWRRPELDKQRLQADREAAEEERRPMLPSGSWPRWRRRFRRPKAALRRSLRASTSAEAGRREAVQQVIGLEAELAASTSWLATDRPVSPGLCLDRAAPPGRGRRR